MLIAVLAGALPGACSSTSSIVSPVTIADSCDVPRSASSTPRTLAAVTTSRRGGRSSSRRAGCVTPVLCFSYTRVSPVDKFIFPGFKTRVRVWGGLSVWLMETDMEKILTASVLFALVIGCGDSGSQSSSTCEALLTVNDGAGMACDGLGQCLDVVCPCLDASRVGFNTCFNGTCVGREGCDEACQDQGSKFGCPGGNQPSADTTDTAVGADTTDTVDTVDNTTYPAVCQSRPYSCQDANSLQQCESESGISGCTLLPITAGCEKYNWGSSCPSEAQTCLITENSNGYCTHWCSNNSHCVGDSGINTTCFITGDMPGICIVD